MIQKLRTSLIDNGNTKSVGALPPLKSNIYERIRDLFSGKTNKQENQEEPRKDIVEDIAIVVNTNPFGGFDELNFVGDSDYIPQILYDSKKRKYQTNPKFNCYQGREMFHILMKERASPDKIKAIFG
ncbi:MAG: hypothetical protein KJ559_00790 [Nanoarchaeota archaeon]|nr:hypothetical protein [Nanoarchaeota archaeon]